MQFTTSHYVCIIHKYNENYYDYCIDLEGYISLKRLLPEKSLEDIENLEDIEDLNVSDASKIRLLHILLKNTIDDDYIAMTNQTFEDIVDTIIDYKAWDPFKTHKRLCG